jgi:hypothetical protein
LNVFSSWLGPGAALGEADFCSGACPEPAMRSFSLTSWPMLVCSSLSEAWSRDSVSGAVSTTGSTRAFATSLPSLTREKLGSQEARYFTSALYYMSTRAVLTEVIDSDLPNYDIQACRYRIERQQLITPSPLSHGLDSRKLTRPVEVSIS